MDKENEVYIYAVEHLAIKNKNAICTIWMDLKAIILSEVERRKQIIYVIIYIQNLKYDTNELITKKKQIHREDTHGCQGGWGWRTDELEGWGEQMQTIIYRMNTQQSLLTV